MNGRIYDARLGRFLQADPMIQSPSNTQGLNRYSYVVNNPLNATDPSGYFIFTALAILNAVLLAAEVITLSTALIGAFAIGFVGALYYGGSFGDALKAGVSAAAMTYVGAEFFPSGDFGLNSATAQYVGVMSVMGGITAVLNGGSFGNGFKMAGVGSALGGAVGKTAALGKALGSTGRGIARIVVGGTMSKLSGGKFANGAATAALSLAIRGTISSPKAEAQFKYPTLKLVRNENGDFDSQTIWVNDSAGTTRNIVTTTEMGQNTVHAMDNTQVAMSQGSVDAIAAINASFATARSKGYMPVANMSDIMRRDNGRAFDRDAPIMAGAVTTLAGGGVVFQGVRWGYRAALGTQTGRAMLYNGLTALSEAQGLVGAEQAVQTMAVLARADAVIRSSTIPRIIHSVAPRALKIK